MSRRVNPNTRFQAALASIRPACGATALVALAFSAVVAAGLLRNYSRMPADPQAGSAFQAMKADLIERPDSDDLKDRIRAEDLRLRGEFFHRRELNHRGARLLAGGAAVFVLAMGLFLSAPPRPARPATRLDADPAAGLLAARARAGVLAAAFLVLGGAVGWVVLAGGGGAPPALSSRAPDAPSPPAARTGPSATGPVALRAALPGIEEIRRNWPRFRGPLGAGVYEGDVPTRWDGNTGEGILWRRELPLPGHSSPVVWGGRVVVTGADAQTRKVFCFDAHTGELLWARAVTADDSPAKAPEVMEDTGLAASSAAADASGFAAIFANGDVAFFDPNGEERWVKNLHFHEDAYGYASSLDLVGGTVVVQIDQGGEEDGHSRLLALDARTGAVFWEAKPPVGGAWTSPLVAPLAEKAAVVSLGNPWLTAHDLDGGEELWRAKVGGADGAPSPILAGGLVVAISSNNEVSAVRADGAGDVTDTHVVWKSQDSVPDIASPVSDGNFVWTVTTHGVLNCYRLTDGNQLSSTELNLNFQASPSLAGGKLFLPAEDGTTLILEAVPGGKEIARCHVPDRIAASPAFHQGRIYVRGAKYLYCIGARE